MIKYYPSFIVASHVGRIYDDSQPRNLLPLYEHFARKAIAFAPSSLECINNTSSINNSELGGFSSMDSVQDTLANLFVSAGDDSFRGKFLEYCGIKTFIDLARPIKISGWDRGFWFPAPIRERILKRSWNECHPGAVYGQCAFLQFTRFGKWSFVVNYGYSRDSSSWALKLVQKNESLKSFCDRIGPWMEELFGQERSVDAYWRNRDNEERDMKQQAVARLFCPDLSYRDEELVTSLLRSDEPLKRIVLSKQRLSVLRQWIREDRRKMKLSDRRTGVGG